MNTQSVSVVLLRLSAFVVAMSAFTGVQAGVLDDAKARGAVRIGQDYVPPAYTAGAKFRTPEGVDIILAEDIAKRLSLKLDSVRNAGTSGDGKAAQALKGARPDIALITVEEGAARSGTAADGSVLIPTGYSAGAMAIMRTDTDIKKWEQLKGRTVCLSEGGSYVGQMAARYGAIEKVMRAPADSLLAVRIGQCDAAVHDDTMLKELLKLPEWKKFSAQLPAQSRSALMIKVPAADGAAIAYFRQTVAEWSRGDFWAALKKKWSNTVAFEVYLDQNVPDCH
ncbi:MULTISPECIES: transporter substrate-binding domain-containing protein [unclassified Herbaspirillum]|uniref:transporter substrate-binding domain-containing protein n=1 Tax=unclassified Herbaspirillum TaxID=2624150 RepID=UPI000E2FB71F|nr:MULTISPECIES: transporter substrate-binding domain-containing protein [unclassified Herbaspirillum]RFB74030.1 ABC transporter substrate-binding protein [Herbaspirillum sp. 3R-3a1]TFI10157.1 transporter substrate-binding domain-containing protein [Herbaspirillum sp. 3R11]TFI16061.1 transporter substrate-binding domain-containing protein [Herbaspirillum sp. 3R-11]TFI18998.1 transporter substrate-binding domain-containing protein [Herbaspirillum sp. 3C11]TFI18999.1 transporter substrate-bindin